MTTFFSDEDEDVVPRIEHGLDCMASEDGNSFEFHYNFLVYHFENGAEAISARHYMDDGRHVSMQVQEERELRTPFAYKVLVYLGMRYDRITWLNDSASDQLPIDLLRQVEAAVNERLGLRPS